MYKIGVISDTHGMLREEVKEHLKGCDVILHGGDINNQKILDELNQIAFVYVIRGNNDKEWAEHLPRTLSLELAGLKIFMIHNKKQIQEDISDRDLIIYGHSHKYEDKQIDGQRWLNPGSCGPRRFSQPITMAVIEVDESGGGSRFQIQKFDIPHAPKASSRGKDSSIRKTDDTCAEKQIIEKQILEKQGTGKRNAGDPQIPENIRSIIQTIMRETDQGRSIEKIAAKLKVNQELAQQICRLYLTHPGVDADGILQKMSL